VTLYSAATNSNVNAARSSTEKVALETLNRFARIMAVIMEISFGDFNDRSAPGIVLMPRGIAQGLASLGWSKDKVKAIFVGEFKSSVRGNQIRFCSFCNGPRNFKVLRERR